MKPEYLKEYIDNAPNFQKVLFQYRLKQKEQERVEKYNAVVNEKKLPLEKLLKDAEDELELLKEERSRVAEQEALEPKKAVEKVKRLQELDNRIEQSNKTITSLHTLIQSMTKETKPVGRPRKDGKPPKQKKIKKPKSKKKNI